MRDKLNALAVKGLTKPGIYSDGAGLNFQVRGPDARAWVFRYTLRGKAHWMGLGRYPEVGLADAREAAGAARKVLANGKDPLTERRAAEAARAAAEAAAVVRTFRDVAGHYIHAHEASWKNAKHRQQWRNTLDAYVFPKLGDKPIVDVSVGDVMDVLQPL
ncbi:MAG: hypothetical protein B7Z80_26865, partial [Rhodospirillales bacterium 20-64-7]